MCIYIYIYIYIHIHIHIHIHISYEHRKRSYARRVDIPGTAPWASRVRAKEESWDGACGALQEPRCARIGAI